MPFDRLLARVLAIALASFSASFCAFALALKILAWSRAAAVEAPSPTRFEGVPLAASILPVLAGLGGLLGFCFALPLLWRSELSRSLPLVFGLTVLAGALLGPIGPPGWIATVVVGVSAMGIGRARWPRLDERQRVAVH